MERSEYKEKSHAADTFDPEYLPPGCGSASILAKRLRNLLKQQNSNDLPPIILCIGTDRIIGDSLGPIVGSSLSRTGLHSYVYGTLECPVHALNLSETLAHIKKKHPGNTLIAVDASLGSKSHIGSVTVRNGGLHPGAGVRKNLNLTGDISVTGVTNTDDSYPWLSLQTARLSTVVRMADCISDGILEACKICM
ncbi:MAG: spore protease YyaC [Lachnospiraceae bacterium]|nr:spore protease YyaC [Lachnospiraceae bacterium]